MPVFYSVSRRVSREQEGLLHWGRIIGDVIPGTGCPLPARNGHWLTSAFTPLWEPKQT